MLLLAVLLSVPAGTSRASLAVPLVSPFPCCCIVQPAYNITFLKVVWTKENPTPWNTVQQDQGTKLLSVNQKFDKQCVYIFLGYIMR
jgi:hypothetical protein